jgi:D-galacturonate reductase
MKQRIGAVYRDMDLRCDTYPADTIINPTAYSDDAIPTYKAGDVAIIFTPDDTHYDIAMACIQQGMHVMVTKPIVQTLTQHRSLLAEARKYNVLVVAEVHKRWDPFYADARDRARSTLGNFNYMYAYMSQPKHQLETFKSWAGTSSDISYYLNSHHVDFSEWTLEGIARPVRVTASSSTGVAHSRGMTKCEDSITLTVTWENISDKTLGCAVYTSSWVAPKSDVHSQQRFFYMGTKGEITVDQAHRGMSVAVDESPYGSVNPLFMKYTPTNGYFSGQSCYGIMTFEVFIDACCEINAGRRTVDSYDDGSLATVGTTLQGTAILEAGRRSLDADGRPMDILYATITTEETKKEGHGHNDPIGIKPHEF